MSWNGRLLAFLKIMREKGCKDTDNTKICSLRLANGLKVLAYCDELEKRGYAERLIDSLCEEKMAFAASIRTEKDEEELWKGPKVYFNGADFVPTGRYHCEAEELLAWSETSLKAPLRAEAVDRMTTLFQKYFGEIPL